MKILLIDATTYSQKMDDELFILKQQYFIVKNHVKNQKFGQHQKPSARTFSIGLLRIASILDFNGYDVTYVHSDDFERNFVYYIETYHPAIVAFSVVCPTVQLCDNIRKKILDIHPDCLIGLGGSHINVAREETIQRYPHFNFYISTFEIEACKELLIDDSINILNPPRYIDYDLLPYNINEYVINTFTQLGCAYNCSYCQDNRLPAICNSLDAGIGVLSNILKPRSCIHIFDSNFGYDLKHLAQSCSAIANTHHDFLMSCDMRAELVTHERLKAICSAGISEIRLGFESGSNRVLEKNNRKMDVDSIIKKLELIRSETDLYISIYVLSGLPGSTFETSKESVRIISQLLSGRIVDEVKNGIYVPYPMDGRNYSDEGIIIEQSNWSMYDRNSYPVFRLSDMSSSEIWQDFTKLTRVIVNSWMKAYEISSVDILEQEIYPEYNILRYS